MDKALAAIQLGYLSRELRFRLASVWLTHPFRPHTDVGPYLKAIDACLNCLSGSMSDDQRARASSLLTQIATRHDGVCEYIVDIAFAALKAAERRTRRDRPVLREIVAEDDGTKLWKRWQQQDWTDLRSLLLGIVRPGSRLAAWFEIGDHLADIRGQLGTQYITEHGQKELAYLSSGVDKLRFPEKEEVKHFFTVVRICPGRTPTALAFFKQIERTYERLCWLIQDHDLQEKPTWDGVTVRYRGQSRPCKRQKRAEEKKEVVAPILDKLQEADWPKSIDAPDEVKDADIRNALYHFNQTAPIRLWQQGGKILWEPASFPSKRKRGGRPKGKRRSARTKNRR